MAILFFFFGCISHSAEIVERAPSTLITGEQRVLYFSNLERYSIGGTSIRALPLKPQKGRPAADSGYLLVKATQPGLSDLWVWNQDGTTEHRSFEVQKIQKTMLRPELARALSRLDESEILFSGEGAVLRGKIHSLEEEGRIAALVQGFPKEIRDETEPNPALLEKAQHLLETWLQGSLFARSLQLEKDGEKLRLSGNLERAQDRVLVEKRARAIYPQIQLDLQTLPDESPTIHFKVFLLELKKNRFGSLGLSWPSSVDSAFRVSTWGTQEALQFDLALQALEGDGSAKILSKPEIVVRAPGEAELFSGGEIPIRTTTRNSSQITWKSYGLLLKLKVTHQAGDRVRLEILTEVSHLDLSGVTGDVPGLQSNRMKTEVDARFGKPLLLSGLLQDGVRQQAKGIPGLRNIPILGTLFGSEDYLNERSELVVILLPQIAPPQPPMEAVSALPTGMPPLIQGGVVEKPVATPKRGLSAAEEETGTAPPLTSASNSIGTRSARRDHVSFRHAPEFEGRLK